MVQYVGYVARMNGDSLARKRLRLSANVTYRHPPNKQLYAVMCSPDTRIGVLGMYQDNVKS